MGDGETPLYDELYAQDPLQSPLPTTEDVWSADVPSGPRIPDGLDIDWTITPEGQGFAVIEGDGESGDTILLDQDLDGRADAVLTRVDGGFVMFVDDDRDGVFETEQSFTDAEMSELQPAVYELLTQGDSVVPEPETSAPPVSDGQVVGDPWAFGDDWFLQAFNGSCLPAAVATIFREYTGADTTDAEFIRLANEQGVWIVGADGTPGIAPQSAEALLDEAGIPAEYLSGQTVADLQAYLTPPPHAVMVSVDSSVIWEGRGADAMDHVVLITGIDAQAGTVFLSDSGTPDGNLLEVDLDTFLESWALGGNEVVVAEQSAEEFRADQGLAEQPSTPDAELDAAAEPAVEPADAPVNASPLSDLSSDSDALTASLAPSPDPMQNVANWVSAHKWVLVPVVVGAGAVIARSAKRKDS